MITKFCIFQQQILINSQVVLGSNFLHNLQAKRHCSMFNKIQPKRPINKGTLMTIRKLDKSENGYIPNQINQQEQIYNAIQATSNNYDKRIVSRTQFPKQQRKAQEFHNAQNNWVNVSEPQKLSNTSLPERNSFSKKSKVLETYSATNVNQTSNNSVLDRMTAHLNNFQGFPKQTLDFLQKGDMARFLTEYEKIDTNNRTKIRQLKDYFVSQQGFYKKLKLIISDNCDSSAFYSDQSFNFFEDVPQIFNKILTELSSKLKTFESFKDGNKKYLSSNTNKKIEDNFDKFMKAIFSLKAEKGKANDEIKAVRNQLARKNNEITDLKEKVNDLQLKLKMLQYSKGEPAQLRQLKGKLRNSEDNEWRLKSQLRQLQTQYEVQAKNLAQYTKKFIESNDENNNLKFDVKKLTDKIQQSEKEIRQLQEEVNKNLQIKLQQPKFAQQQFSKVNSKTDNSEIKNLKMQLQNANREIDQNENLIYQLRMNQDEYKSAIQQLEDRIRQLSVNKKEDLSKYYLESSWLLEYNDKTEKSRLINMIKDYCYCQPLQFKLLYKHQKFQQSNFHEYIDNKSNFLILIRLINNNVIGGFCPYPLAKNQKPNAGFLFNLTSNSLYPLKEGKSCYIYDDFYLSMGNSQIRIRMSDNFVYSSFGIQHEHFQSKNHTIGNFFCGSDSKSIQRQMPFIGYEVYEVKLVE